MATDGQKDKQPEVDKASRAQSCPPTPSHFKVPGAKVCTSPPPAPSKTNGHQGSLNVQAVAQRRPRIGRWGSGAGGRAGRPARAGRGLRWGGRAGGGDRCLSWAKPSVRSNASSPPPPLPQSQAKPKDNKIKNVNSKTGKSGVAELSKYSPFHWQVQIFF